MGFKLKSSIRKRVKEQLGATEEQIAEAEKNCDGCLYLMPKDGSVISCAHALTIRCADGERTILFPVDSFIRQPEDEAEEE